MVGSAHRPPAPPRPAPRAMYEACPLCGGADFPFLRLGDCSKHALYRPTMPASLRWHRCSACRHVFTEGYFTAEATEPLFNRTQPQQQVGHEMDLHRLVSSRIVDRVVRHVREGDWLDVGFGNAALIFTADEFGFRASGIDLRPENVADLKRAGFEAHCTDIAGLNRPGRYSVISMADVLEHMPFPIMGLEAAHRLLVPGGVLFISMPNMDCALWRMFDLANANPYWGELEHYHNFGRKRLYELLAQQGFNPREYSVSERYRACMEIIATRED
jgi:SAM-dependent methyltransferase